MKTINKITGRKTTVTIKKPYTYNYYGVTTTLAKGAKFNARDVREEGLVIVLGHGAAEVVPHEYLGKYTLTYTEVDVRGDGRNGVLETKRIVTENVTEDYVAYWKKLADKRAAANAHVARVDLKRRIADLRKTIKYVKTGKAETELTELFAKLA